jgi:hypothetical protein
VDAGGGGVRINGVPYELLHENVFVLELDVANWITWRAVVQCHALPGQCKPA